MSQTRPFQMVGGGGGNINVRGHFDDTTYTKIFVGGLAWETQRDTMRRYFEQFGEIQEAVVITDKITGRSKGYGFVTFKDPDAATRACQNPSPVIDGRRANCNLASLGAHKTRPSTPQHGTGRFRPTHGVVSPPASAFHHQGSSSTYFHQPTGQYTFPYSAYGYTGYSQDTMYPLNYYGVYGGQQFSPYYTAGTSYQNLYPFYAQNSQQAHGHGVGIHQYPRMVQYPYLPQHYSSMGIQLSLPSSVPMATTTTESAVLASRIPNATGVTAAAAAVTGTSASQASKTVSEQNSST